MQLGAYLLVYYCFKSAALHFAVHFLRTKNDRLMWTYFILMG